MFSVGFERVSKKRPCRICSKPTQNKLCPHSVRVPTPLTFTLFLLLVLAVPESAAQQTNVSAEQQQTSADENRRNEFGVWGGISFDAPAWIGKTPDAHSVTLAYVTVVSWQQMMILPFHGPLMPFRWQLYQSTNSQSYRQAQARSPFSAGEITPTARVSHQSD